MIAGFVFSCIALCTLYRVIIAGRERKNWAELHRLMSSSPSSTSNIKNAESDGNTSLRVKELLIYPVKSLRGVRVPAALLTPEGFYLDRRYMLVKISDDSLPKSEAMVISKIPAMGLFATEILPESVEMFTITYHGQDKRIGDTITIPFEPSKCQLASLERIHIDMYHSTCFAYDMGARYNDWFSERFGFKVVLAFWGENPRPVLGNIPGKPATYYPTEPNSLVRLIRSIPMLKDIIPKATGIAFNDMAPYLVINETSVSDVTARLDRPMDATKFRPNIIISGSSTVYEEDFWAELVFNPSLPTKSCKMQLTANCTRCASLNVDYNEGKFAEGVEGEVLKKLMKDRRVDKGMKWNPVFGRYGFLEKAGEGKILRVGDEVIVSKRNEERTTFAWKGYS